jgi:hypothetical protein
MLKEGLAAKRTITQVNRVNDYQVMIYSRVAIKTYMKNAQDVT